MGLHKTDENLNVAKRENSVIMTETDFVNRYDGFDPNSPMAHITFSLYQNAYLEQSLVFAELIEKQFKDRAGRKSRGVKQAGFLVLYKTAMPSVLIESGFLSNMSEEEFLNSEYGQDIIASAIFRAFRTYKEEAEAAGSIAYISAEDDPVPEPEPVIVEVKKVETEVNKEDSKELIKKTRVLPENLSYKIQIFASKDENKLKEVDYKKITRIEMEQAPNGLKRFVVGNFKDRLACEKYLEEIKESGFKDAYIVRYSNGKRIN